MWAFLPRYGWLLGKSEGGGWQNGAPQTVIFVYVVLLFQTQHISNIPLLLVGSARLHLLWNVILRIPNKVIQL